MEANAPIWEVSQARPAQLRAGLFTWATLVLPFVRRLHGLEKIDLQQRYILVANHVSLLDALILCGLLTRKGRGPVLVLADKTVWTSSIIRRWLSRSFGFLVERGKFNPARLRELEVYGSAARNYHLLVFPEGTRGNGVDVAECQPGIFYIAQAARVPIIPIFIENMQKVSTKTGKFHLFGGLKKVDIHFGEPIAPESYATLPREEFTEFIRRKILEVRDQRSGGSA